ncbi:MAG TPA: class I SAM-dependent methyltransferase [Opitutaceae bacterium]|nr:class I SAM-dependent methyltransferase [Opitutaceae bacterium]
MKYVDMEAIYAKTPAADLPWDVATPPAPLVHLIEDAQIPRGRAVDFGCGTGNYSIYLAQRGFEVTGVDISPTAIGIARQRARQQGVKCDFLVADVLGDLAQLTKPFDFAFDWELLHHLYPEHREKYVRNIWAKLVPRGLYLSLCFSEHDPQFGGSGKYRTTSIGTVLYFSSEAELRALFEPGFEIRELKTIPVQAKHGPHLAVYAFMQRRLHGSQDTVRASSHGGPRATS